MTDAVLFADIAQKAHAVLTQHVKSTLNGKVYQGDKIKTWTEDIMSSCTRDLSKLSPNFKYIVSCLIVENMGVNVHNGCACNWDTASDGIQLVTFSNKHLQCICTVFGVAL